MSGAFELHPLYDISDGLCGLLQLYYTDPQRYQDILY